MNRISLLAACALLCCAASARSSATIALSRFGYHGPVKHVVVHEQGNDVPQRVKEEISFDRDGNPALLTRYGYNFMDGSLRTVSETRFDGQGNSTVVEQRDPDGALLERTEYRYQGGRVVELRTTDADGNETRRQTYDYNGDGHVVRDETYRDGDLAFVSELSYDAQGHRVARQRFDGEGTLLTDRSYSDEGRSYEQVRYDDEGNVRDRSRAQMDDDGHFTELIGFEADGSEKNHTTYRYQDGLLVERDYKTGTTDTVTRFEYTFDDVGNWVKRTQVETIDGTPADTWTETRSFEYFD